MKLIYTIILLICSYSISFGQLNLESYEAEISGLFNKLKQQEDDKAKLILCDSIENKIYAALLIDKNKNYPFIKLTNMGKLKSADDKFRILNWNCIMSDGEYRYFGIVQYLSNNKNVVVRLKDNINKQEDLYKQLSASKWLGALYYKIIPFKVKGKVAYALLAWDGNNVRTNRKIIEILSFDSNNKLVFGLPVIYWRGKVLSRVIFEYAKQARMSLSYHKSKKQIVFDHLSPSEGRYEGQMDYYGPDFTYDALRFRKGKWNLYENIDVRNSQK